MATHFSANQYQDAFTPKKLCNWEVPAQHRQNPRCLEGFTQIIANDRGALYEGAPRSAKNPWGNYVGTWDLPKRIPGNCARVGTGRTSYAQEKLQTESCDASRVLAGTVKNETRKTMKNPYQQIARMVSSAPASGRRSGAAGVGSKLFPKSPYPKEEAVDIPSPFRRSPEPILTPVVPEASAGNRTATPPIKSPQAERMITPII